MKLLRVVVEPEMLFYENLINPKPVANNTMRVQNPSSLGGSSTPIFYPGTSSTPISSPTPFTPYIYYGGSSSNTECSNCNHLLGRIKDNTRPAGILQKAMLRKKADVHAGGHENILTTQEYVKKINEDVSEDDHFTQVPWLMAIMYLHGQGVIASGCLGDVEKY
nr:hypothetical protein [Tanacetum cinerariifolium]